MRGGKREGAGAKPKQEEEKLTAISLKLPKDVLNWLNDNIPSGKRNGFIVEAIRVHMDRQQNGG